MNLFGEYPDTEIRFGDDALDGLPGILERYGVRRAVLFTGRRSADASGAAQAVTEAAAGVEIIRFREIPPEPDTGDVETMAALLREVRPDLVIALGGGSALDAAKAAQVLYRTGRSLEACFGQDRVPDAPGLERLIAIPTTSGTGSEVTPYSNIVDRKRGVKKLIADAKIIPPHALVVPSFTAGLPADVTLATGCDALAHLIEGFLNTARDAACPRANAWALAGIEAVVRHLENAVKAPSPAARSGMAEAATLGGMVIRCKPTGLPHLASYSWFGRLAHGIAVVMLLPAAWRYYLGNPAVSRRTMELARIFPGDTPEEVIASFRRFLSRVGVPETLAAFPELTPEVLRRTAAGAAENPMKLASAPRPVPLEAAEQVIASILAQS